VKTEPQRLIAPPGTCRLDAFLAAQLPHSRSRLAGVIRDGHVQVDGVVVAAPKHKLRGGEAVQVHVPPPPSSELIAQDLGLPVVHLDDDVIVVNKPTGMVVHPARGHPSGTVVNAVLHLLQPPVEGQMVRGHPVDVTRPGIVHRLDRGTSGVMVVARHPDAHAQLAQQFHDHTIGRRYVCIVLGETREDAGTVDAVLGRHPVDRLRFAVSERGRHAVTHWNVVGRAKGLASLVVCRLETGRTHQIRVHLAHIGMPVLGDPLYGLKRWPTPVRSALGAVAHQLLHAFRLDFDHPATGVRVGFRAPPPPEFLAVAEALGLSDALAALLAAPTTE
jgi:23S rRNA pseudouridine1911/1915/1917 synthase